MPASDGDDYHDHGFGEASRYAAHLDRGWALLEQGDAASARTSADHAQQARPEDPDAAVLLGAVALAEGQLDESLRCYERALELDGDYLEPYAAAAQLCLFDLDDPARALGYCEDALDLEGLAPFERLDLTLMAAECELVQGSVDAAAARIDALAVVDALRLALEFGAAPDPETPDDDDDLEIDLGTDRGVALAFVRTDAEGEPLEQEERVERVHRASQFALRLARLQIDLGRADFAATLMGQVTEWYPNDADAWYLLSEAGYRDGAPLMSSHAALRALELDEAPPLPDWAPSPALLHQQVLETLTACPDETLRNLVQGDDPIALVVRESPSPELVLEGVDPRLAALALASRTGGDSAEPGAPALTALALYRRSLCRYARDPDQLGHELRMSVFDELATFLGLNDARRDAIGLPPLPEALRAATSGDAAGPAPTSGADDAEPTRRKSRRRRRS